MNLKNRGSTPPQGTSNSVKSSADKFRPRSLQASVKMDNRN